jgi:hypothetical protein
MPIFMVQLNLVVTAQLDSKHFKFIIGKRKDPFQVTIFYLFLDFDFDFDFALAFAMQSKSLHIY